MMEAMNEILIKHFTEYDDISIMTKLLDGV